MSSGNIRRFWSLASTDAAPVWARDMVKANPGARVYRSGTMVRVLLGGRFFDSGGKRSHAPRAIQRYLGCCPHCGKDIATTIDGRPEVDAAGGECLVCRWALCRRCGGSWC